MAGKFKACVLLLALTACTHVIADTDEAVVSVKGEGAFATLIKARAVGATALRARADTHWRYIFVS